MTLKLSQSGILPILTTVKLFVLFFKILFLFTHLEEQAQITRKTETKEFISDILVRRFELSEL